jgi:hypothetical protein
MTKFGVTRACMAIDFSPWFELNLARRPEIGQEKL